MKTVALRLRAQRRPLADGRGACSTRLADPDEGAGNLGGHAARRRASIPRSSTAMREVGIDLVGREPRKLDRRARGEAHDARHDGLRRGVPRRARACAATTGRSRIRRASPSSTCARSATTSAGAYRR